MKSSEHEKSHYVFISYSAVDSKIALSIVETLRKLGVKCFLDQKDIQWGDGITPSVRTGIEECTALIVVISPASVKSPWVSFEVGQATAHKKVILPFLVHPSMERPDFLRDLRYVETLKAIEDFFFAPPSDLNSFLSLRSQKKLTSQANPDDGYFLHERKITSVFQSRTTGTITHDVRIEALRDKVTHYRGRHRNKPFRDIRHYPSHFNFAYVEHDDHFKHFLLHFDKALNKEESLEMKFEHDWNTFPNAVTAEMVTIACETKRLIFRVELPVGEQFTAVYGHERINSTVIDSLHVYIPEVNGNIITWEVVPHFGFYYKLTWAWVNKALTPI